MRQESVFLVESTQTHIDSQSTLETQREEAVLTAKSTLSDVTIKNDVLLQKAKSI